MPLTLCRIQHSPFRSENPGLNCKTLTAVRHRGLVSKAKNQLHKLDWPPLRFDISTRTVRPLPLLSWFVTPLRCYYDLAGHCPSTQNAPIRSATDFDPCCYDPAGHSPSTLSTTMRPATVLRPLPDILGTESHSATN